MFNFFNADNKVAYVIGKFVDMICLNFFFLMGCIPIVTIGTSLSALYHVMFQEVRGEDPYLARNFWRAYRENFKSTWRQWLIMFGIEVLLLLDVLLVRCMAASIVKSALGIIVIFVQTLYLFIFSYLFPLQDQFGYTWKESFWKACFFSIAHFPTSIILIVVNMLPVVVTMVVVNSFPIILFYMAIFGFAIQALVNTIFLEHIFQPFQSQDAE